PMFALPASRPDLPPHRTAQELCLANRRRVRRAHKTEPEFSMMRIAWRTPGSIDHCAAAGACTLSYVRRTSVCALWPSTCASDTVFNVSPLAPIQICASPLPAGIVVWVCAAYTVARWPSIVSVRITLQSDNELPVSRWASRTSFGVAGVFSHRPLLPMYNVVVV